MTAEKQTYQFFGCLYEIFYIPRGRHMSRIRILVFGAFGFQPKVDRARLQHENDHMRHVRRLEIPSGKLDYVAFAGFSARREGRAQIAHDVVDAGINLRENEKILEIQRN